MGVFFVGEILLVHCIHSQDSGVHQPNIKIDFKLISILKIHTPTKREHSICASFQIPCGFGFSVSNSREPNEDLEMCGLDFFSL